MTTLFDLITHWKTIGEWEKIKEVFGAATTLDRFYHITFFVRQHKAQYGAHYRNRILADKDFVRLFGYLDLEYLKKAIKSMNKIMEYSSNSSRV